MEDEEVGGQLPPPQRQLSSKHSKKKRLSEEGLGEHIFLFEASSEINCGWKHNSLIRV